MTEHEWLASVDPSAMLEFLHGRTSERKLRLLACASCRLIWPSLIDPRSRAAVEAAEEYADGAIALTPKVFEDTLALTGPITLAISVAEGVLSVNGVGLPAGTYTITTSLSIPLGMPG